MTNSSDIISHQTSPARRRTRRLGVTAAATAATGLALAASGAQAKTYCVNVASCPTGGIAKSSVDAALNDPAGADANPDADEIRIGPGTYPVQNGIADEQVRIVGAGIGETTLVPGGNKSGLTLADGDGAVEDLSMRIEHNTIPAGVVLRHGADATRVRVYSTADTFPVDGFRALESGSVLDHVETDLTYNGSIHGASFEGAGTVTDSTLIAGIGVDSAASGDVTVRRSTLRASTGMQATPGQLTARNVVVTPHPRKPSAFLNGVYAVPSDTGTNATVNASHLTLVGSGAGSGIDARVLALGSNGGKATINVSDSVIRGFKYSVERHGESAPKAAVVSLSNTVYDGATAIDDGNGSINAPKETNHPDNPDPKFVDPGALDFRPRFDSLLIDNGHDAATYFDGEGDRNGALRVRDGNGNGSVARDIGAYEYQRLAPVAAFGLGSTGAIVGMPLAFTNTSTDPDGDPLTYAWSFGDGGTDTAANPVRSYPAAGSYAATLRASDPAGLSATTSRPVAVAAKPSNGGGGGGGVRVSDTTRPILSALKLSKSRLSRKAKTASKVSFTLSEASRVRFTVERRVSGRRSRKRWTALRGSIVRAGVKGSNRFAFSAKVSGKKLKPGTYRLTGVATDGARNASASRSAGFVVTR